MADVVKKELRPYQLAAIMGVVDEFKRGNRRVVVQLPTGAGKTLTASRMIDLTLRKGNRAIFTAPAISLIDQTVRAFEAEGIRDIGVMQADHPRTDPDAPVQIASVQTLARRQVPPASLVIVDECHIRSEAVDRLMADRPDVYFIGLSATPWARGMGLQWQALLCPVTIGDLIDQGNLSKFTVYAPDTPDLAGVKVRAGEYVEAGLARIMGAAPLVRSIVATWLERSAGRPTLAFGVNREHAAKLEAEFQRRGIAAAYIDGDTPTREREAIAIAFRRGDVRVICSVRTMTTGVDLPVSCIIDAAPTKSEMLHVQKIGRGLRVNPGTEDCVILDHAGNSLRLGLVTDIHHDHLDTTSPGDAPMSSGARRLPRICPACGTVTAGRCPTCGAAAPSPPPNDPPQAQRMVKVEPAAEVSVAIAGDDRARWFAGLLHIQRARNYSPKWPKASYHKRFRAWPDFPRPIVPEPPAPDVLAWVEAERARFIREKIRNGR